MAEGRVDELLTASGRLRLKTTDDKTAHRILASLRLDTSADPEGLTVKVPAARAWQLTKALADLGVYVCELEPVQLSLERYFLDVTGSGSNQAGKQASGHA